MNGVNVKNLIAGFLLLAVAITSSAVFLLAQENIGVDMATQPQNITRELPENVFVENPGAENPAFYEAGKNLLATNQEAGPDPLEAAGDNLTEKLIASLGGQLEQMNPEGPFAVNGEPGLRSPDIETILADLGGAGQLARLVPDWESEIIFLYRPKLVAGSRPEDMTAYRAAHKRLLDTYFNVDPERIIVSFKPEDLPIATAIRDAQGISVPEPFAEYHGSLLKVLAYQKKTIELFRLTETDPLKASIIADVQEENYFAAVALFEQESRRAAQLGLFGPNENASLLASTFYAVFGIPTANAGWVTFNLIRLARAVWKYLKQEVLGVLKEVLVHRLVTQTIKWIQGGGKPQFVTNWKAFLTGVAKDEAGKMMDKYAPRLCQSFGPLVQVAVIPVDYGRDMNVGPTCTLDQVVGNVRQFMDSFESGGWIAYGAAMQPSNNFFGAMFQLSGIMEKEAETKKEGTKSDIESSSGFLSNKECIKWKDSEYDTCLAQLNDYCQTNNLSIDDCQSLLDPFCGGMSTGNDCEEFRNTTPGETLYGAIGDSIKAPLERIVNAKDAIALLSVLLNAALSKLSQLGKSTVSKGILGLDSGTAYIDQSGPIETGPPAGGGGGGGGGGTVVTDNDGVVFGAVDTCAAAHGVSDAGCSPNFNLGAPGGASYQSYMRCLESTISSQSGGSLVAREDPVGGGEFNVKAADGSYSDQYHIWTSAGCAQKKNKGRDVPSSW